jgi:hypothetical protein
LQVEAAEAAVTAEAAVEAAVPVATVLPTSLKLQVVEHQAKRGFR